MTAVALARGEPLPDRSSTYTDPDTGATVHQLTSDASINHSFFFLNPSFRPGHDDQLGFVTHRGDKPQICLHDAQTGGSTCLTDREGVHAFSPVFSPDGKCIFYTTNTAEVWRIDLDSLSEDCLATLEGAGLPRRALLGVELRLGAGAARNAAPRGAPKLSGTGAGASSRRPIAGIVCRRDEHAV